MTILCYCGSRLTFANCCDPLLQGENTAQTPEALMRSRYSAFCTGNVEYLLQTHISEQSSGDEAAQIRATIASTEWLKLNVMASKTSGDTGVVEFVAHYRDQRGVGQLHERSDFLKRENRWFYMGGKHLPPHKSQRNEPCWCGSGKKFKKCCGI